MFELKWPQNFQGSFEDKLSFNVETTFTNFFKNLNSNAKKKLSYSYKFPPLCVWLNEMGWGWCGFWLQWQPYQQLQLARLSRFGGVRISSTPSQAHVGPTTEWFLVTNVIKHVMLANTIPCIVKKCINFVASQIEWRLYNQFGKFSKYNGAYVIINIFINISALFCRWICN